ncbi:putative zinc finger/helix-turn-helix protein, YgiT family [Actinobacillus pleuropneumoniae]|uniref:helix-turn-helix transcriptional regulator n=1 Tax=Actinobacillus pleuropneumoniae TaxID=715 RepID=UPI000DA2ADC0|nr:helix-turn-helix domain-containing protein [Actinobacillus pleuropneumoniae]UKH42075.1 XRE family transcriptional regulator [Actinobacillus pleuropneumoniae serovar 4 str. M62]SQF65672.1 putative zinc finger/helix-turn-helix protein, YgiT family [Actinobacillus pleuropneumoniae]
MIGNTEFGYTPNNLKMLRKHHNLTQTDVANILGVGQRIVMRWETELSSTAARSDMPYKKWAELLKNLQKN